MVYSKNKRRSSSSDDGSGSGDNGGGGGGGDGDGGGSNGGDNGTTTAATTAAAAAAAAATAAAGSGGIVASLEATPQGEAAAVATAAWLQPLGWEQQEPMDAAAAGTAPGDAAQPKNKKRRARAGREKADIQREEGAEAHQGRRGRGRVEDDGSQGIACSSRRPQNLTDSAAASVTAHGRHPS